MFPLQNQSKLIEGRSSHFEDQPSASFLFAFQGEEHFQSLINLIYLSLILLVIQGNLTSLVSLHKLAVVLSQMVQKKLDELFA